MKLFARRRCDNCKHWHQEHQYSGICPKLGVINKRAELILDGVDVFDKLNIDKIEYRHPIVQMGFSCCYWEERKR